MNEQVGLNIALTRKQVEELYLSGSVRIPFGKEGVIRIAESDRWDMNGHRVDDVPVAKARLNPEGYTEDISQKLRTMEDVAGDVLHDSQHGFISGEELKNVVESLEVDNNIDSDKLLAEIKKMADESKKPVSEVITKGDAIKDAMKKLGVYNAINSAEWAEGLKKGALKKDPYEVYDDFPKSEPIDLPNGEPDIEGSLKGINLENIKLESIEQPSIKLKGINDLDIPPLDIGMMSPTGESAISNSKININVDINPEIKNELKTIQKRINDALENNLGQMF